MIQARVNPFAPSAPLRLIDTSKIKIVTAITRDSTCLLNRLLLSPQSSQSDTARRTISYPKRRGEKRLAALYKSQILVKLKRSVLIHHTDKKLNLRL